MERSIIISRAHLLLGAIKARIHLSGSEFEESTLQIDLENRSKALKKLYDLILVVHFDR